MASLVAHMVKNLPAMQETWVQFLGQKEPLVKGMATHSSILAYRIPWPETQDYKELHFNKKFLIKIKVRLSFLSLSHTPMFIFP